LLLIGKQESTRPTSAPPATNRGVASDENHGRSALRRRAFQTQIVYTKVHTDMQSVIIEEKQPVQWASTASRDGFQ
jgi:hypothetical protein